MTLSFLKIQNTSISQLNRFRAAFEIQISSYLWLAMKTIPRIC